MRSRGLGPTIALLVILGLVISVVKLWRFSPYKVSRDVVGNPQVVLRLHGVKIVGRSHGTRIWTFQADYIDVTRGHLRTMITGVHDGKLFDKGKLVAKVTAGEAVYDAINQNLEVTGGAKVDAALGFKASTDRVLWSSANEQLTCPGRVVFTSGDSKLVGQNLLADVRRREVTMDKGRMQVEMDDLQKLQDGDAPKSRPGKKI